VNVNAGSGPHHPPGWVDVDIDPAGGPHVLADVAALPFPAGSADRIYASHLLEHLDYWTEMPAALAEFRRILAPAGVLVVICPDIERAILCGEPRQLLEAVIAWPGEWNIAKWPVKTPPRGHAWTATAAFVAAALDRAGFGERADMSGRLGVLAARGWPVVDLGDWQCGFAVGRGGPPG